MGRNADSRRRGLIEFSRSVPGPITVRASTSVREEAITIAVERIRALLEECPVIARNLAAAGAELQLLAEAERVTDLPQYAHMRGIPFDGERTMDERGRGYGGLHACCGEESLLCLPSSRHADHRDICSHEMAHTVLSFGLDDTLRHRIEARYQAALAAGLWKDAYASTNAHEFFAETTMWWVGSRGDYGPLAAEPGRAWLKRYDPKTADLLESIYMGQVQPEEVAWQVLEPSNVTRSIEARQRATVVFVNRTSEDLELRWLNYDGDEKPYGIVRAGCIETQHTWQSHPWVLVGANQGFGPFVASSAAARVELGPGTEQIPQVS